MKAVSTIQVTSEEDKEIAHLKEELGLPSKKAVVLEGLRSLRKLLEDQRRHHRLQSASLLVRKGSSKINREWAAHSTALKAR